MSHTFLRVASTLKLLTASAWKDDGKGMYTRSGVKIPIKTEDGRKYQFTLNFRVDARKEGKFLLEVNVMGQSKWDELDTGLHPVPKSLEEAQGFVDYWIEESTKQNTLKPDLD